MNLQLLSELLQTSASACEQFIKSEMALNDGDVDLCQKASKDGQQLIKTLIADTFDEFQEEFNSLTNQTNDYDYPNNFELIKALNNLSINVGGMLGAEDDRILKMYAEKAQQSINTVKEIYLALFEN